MRDKNPVSNAMPEQLRKYAPAPQSEAIAPGVEAGSLVNAIVSSYTGPTRMTAGDFSA